MLMYSNVKHIDRFRHYDVQQMCVLTDEPRLPGWIPSKSLHDDVLKRFSCCTVTSIFLGSALLQTALPLVWSQGLQPHKASPMGWSFLFRIPHHAAAGEAALAVALGFPLIERDLQFSVTASVSMSRSDTTLLYLAVWLKAECAFSAVFPQCLLSCETPVNRIVVVFMIWGCNVHFVLWPIWLPEFCFSVTVMLGYLSS